MTTTYEQHKSGVVTIKHCRIIGRNFSGEKSDKNPNGDRTFCVIVDDPAFAHSLKEIGWNIKPRKYDDESFYIPVKVSLNNDKFPVTIKMRNEGSSHWLTLNERTVPNLDGAYIVDASVTLRPRTWGDNNEHVKAYLKTLYAEIETDSLASMYNDDISYTEESTDSQFAAVDEDIPF